MWLSLCCSYSTGIRVQYSAVHHRDPVCIQYTVLYSMHTVYSRGLLTTTANCRLQSNFVIDRLALSSDFHCFIRMSKQVLYQLGDVSQANIQQLKALNIATLPVRYSEKFYRDLISNYTTDYLKYAVWNGFVVASVCARVETSPEDPDKSKLYVMTINVLAPYRRRGIGKDCFQA